MAGVRVLLALSMALAGTALGGNSSRLVMSPLHFRTAAAGPDVALNVSDVIAKGPMHYSGYFQVVTLLWYLARLACSAIKACLPHPERDFLAPALLNRRE